MSCEGSSPITAVCRVSPREPWLQVTPRRNTPAVLEWAWVTGHMGGSRLRRSKLHSLTLKSGIINPLHSSTHFGRDHLETLLKPILYHLQ